MSYKILIASIFLILVYYIANLQVFFLGFGHIGLLAFFVMYGYNGYKYYKNIYRFIVWVMIPVFAGISFQLQSAELAKVFTFGFLACFGFTIYYNINKVEYAIRNALICSAVILDVSMIINQNIILNHVIFSSWMADFFIIILILAAFVFKYNRGYGMKKYSGAVSFIYNHPIITLGSMTFFTLLSIRLLLFDMSGRIVNITELHLWILLVIILIFGVSFVSFVVWWRRMVPSYFMKGDITWRNRR
jgi:hypothetical protein